MNNLVKFGLLTLIFRNLKLFIYVAGGTVLLIWWWAVGQLPEEPEIPPIEDVLAEIDDNKITECKEKLYLVAINYDSDDQSTVQLKEDFADAYIDFIEYYFSDEIQKVEDTKPTLSTYSGLYYKLTNSQPPGPNGNLAKIIDEFGFIADRFSNDRIDGTIQNLNYIQKMYVAIKYYPEDPGLDYAKLFCSFY
tara:strand:+ start:79 stop:654 length:576 start_codon:yes stop_codon:yes gene_type:complete